MHERLDREGVAALIGTQPGFELVGSAGTGQEVISLCVRHRPQVMILGMLVAWPHAVRVIEAIRMSSPETRVLALAPHTGPRCAVLNPGSSELDGCLLGSSSGACLASALAHGALGALDRDAAPGELFRAIRALARGEHWIGSGVALHEGPELPLSTRERTVSLLVGAGNSNKQIATALHIGEATVKKHISHVLRKLGLRDRLQLGLCVVRHMPSFKTD